MITTIIACIIANLLTIIIIGAALYFIYRKNQDKIESAVAELKDKINDVKSEMTESIELVTSAVESIKDFFSPKSIEDEAVS